MALNFDNIPSEKPSNIKPITPGRYVAKIIKAEMRVGKTSGNEYLNVSFKLEQGGFVNDNYFDTDAPFNQYKIGRLLKACGVKLEGEFTLNDIRKVIVNKEVIIDAASNDRGYGIIDYSGSNEGIYATNATALEDAREAEGNAQALDQDISEAIDEDF